jgi:hypothetical protein
MARLFALVLLAHTVLAVVALISCLSAESEEIRTLRRPVWVPTILFVVLLGPIAWFVAGRPAPAATQQWQLRTSWPKAARPVAPDDDPEFLQSLDTGRSQEDRDLFEKWERDLRHREEDRRNQAGEDGQQRPGDDGQQRPGGDGRGGTNDDRRRGTDDEHRRGTGDDLRQQNEEGQPEG